MLLDLGDKRRAFIARNRDALIDRGQRAGGEPDIDDGAVDGGEVS
ncbi:MAG TPA: hypothetical protein VHA77_07485 [Xanthobacteraceae bacterium]|nr:hypothetical protein [Xanthobacteraceae bacterium]